MAVTFPIRLFGGRNCGVIYDSAANTISVQGQSLTLSSLSAALQQLWATAVANTVPSSKPTFGSDNISASVGAIMDATPTWRNAVQTALASYVASISVGGIADAELWNR